MPRYFFDFHAGERLACDEHGVVLSGPQAAEAEAINSLCDLARDRLPGERQVVVEVRDEGGRQMLTAKLALTVQKAGRPC
jgi:hypothetical protein